jgi:hypothetical protein
MHVTQILQILASLATDDLLKLRSAVTKELNSRSPLCVVRCWIGEMALSSKAIGHQFFFVVLNDNSQKHIYVVYPDRTTIDTRKAEYHDNMTQYEFRIPENIVIQWRYWNSYSGTNAENSTRYLVTKKNAVYGVKMGIEGELVEISKDQVADYL